MLRIICLCRADCVLFRNMKILIWYKHNTKYQNKNFMNLKNHSMLIDFLKFFKFL